MLVVYYSGGSEYTHKFVNKLDHPGLRLPLLTKDPTPIVSEPFVLITPTYGAGRNRGAVPKQVIKFLNVEENRNRLVGVIGAGNTNFGEYYCAAAYKVAAKCQVPLLYNFELLGMPEDVEKVNKGLDSLCQQPLKTAT
ncbi:class Ib ribonucleoside-diphosphate reductase assembly flavoprotein NrdI [Brevibacterium gallinarum]|uniref:Protein NrdI n=1 Tax=Brevibacterium gallinarum TaxID=2762220 RepID=A0ABR8WXT8_9MICO|nr:class Ib ribonucleoside-diphosphate reductase assembly flavoprotein NrdI [Brevibacterium gallinarum]MBD8021757.1 class Ib ribonucleoside-diphosphate reductase assembly flavoprotein NrdI [Brevibacterium gallinarum]